MKSKSHIEPRRKAGKELIGVLLELKNPRARLSRTEKKGVPFSCLGEFLWYFSGRNDLDFICHYVPQYREESDDGKTIHGAYGPRLMGKQGVNQVENVLNLLGTRRDSRRAVIQLFSAEDLAGDYKDIPCTCTLQFMLRRNRLHMLTSMRSNDAFRGLPHDVFAFTMMQEIFARTLKVELGTYKHVVGSLHLYDKDRDGAQAFLDEGWQRSIAMPSMPLDDTEPLKALQKVLRAEEMIRRNRAIDISKLRLDSYWEDLVRLLQIYQYYAQDRKTPSFSLKKESQAAIVKIKKEMKSRMYDVYINKKRRAAERKLISQGPVQARLL
ncbi:MULTISPECIES: thymidylate synthase [Corallococcus]|uniref:thymidylate synthase n=1 Tax=Corallococcus TaxID=83461 RepID=UPI0018F33824|nr:thymidylate synthase [Corallococcus sp. AB032C]